MNCNFYLDRPYNQGIDSKVINEERRKAKDKNRRLPEKFLNPKPTSIYLFFSPDKGSRIKYRTSLKVEAKNWDFETHKIRSNAPGAFELNIELNAIEKKIIEEVYAAQRTKEFLTAKDYKRIIAEVVDGKNNLPPVDLLNQKIIEFIDDKSKYVKEGTMKEYRTVFKALEDFQKQLKDALTLMDLDKNFYIKFEAFLSKKKNYSSGEKGLKNDTIYKYISTLRTFMRWCHDQGETVPDYTFKKHHTVFKKQTKNEIIVLTEKEIQLLEEIDLEDVKYLDRVRDLFLFLIYTGQRFSDAIRFSKADFYGDRWEFTSQKNGKRVTVPFYGYIENGLRVLEKYNFQLPTISNQKFNEYIKEVGKRAEINTLTRRVRYKGNEEIIDERAKYEFMSSHMGRRTAVTTLLSRGVPVTLVQQLTQHSKISTLMKYEGAGTNSLIDALKRF